MRRAAATAWPDEYRRHAATASTQTRYCGLRTRLVTSTTSNSASMRSAGSIAARDSAVARDSSGLRDERGSHQRAAAASTTTTSTNEQIVATSCASLDPNCNAPQAYDGPACSPTMCARTNGVAETASTCRPRAFCAPRKPKASRHQPAANSTPATSATAPTNPAAIRTRARWAALSAGRPDGSPEHPRSRPANRMPAPDPPNASSNSTGHTFTAVPRPTARPTLPQRPQLYLFGPLGVDPPSPATAVTASTAGTMSNRAIDTGPSAQIPTSQNRTADAERRARMPVIAASDARISRKNPTSYGNPVAASSTDGTTNTMAAAGGYCQRSSPTGRPRPWSRPSPH